MTTHDNDWLAETFQENRLRLRAVAYRLLGSASDAEEAVRESWLRVSDEGTSGAGNVAARLTATVARVCLERLDARHPSGTSDVPDSGVQADDAVSPDRDASRTEAAGPELLGALERLTPAERVAFVLHDLFDVPLDDIAQIVGRTPAAALQLASRARGRIRAAAPPYADHAEQRRVIDAFLAASRAGNAEALLALLDPEVVMRADEATVRLGSDREARGADAVAATFKGRARFARPALLDGVLGGISAPGGIPRVAFTLAVRDGRIAVIELSADPEHLRRLDVLPLDGRTGPGG